MLLSYNLTTSPSLICTLLRRKSLELDIERIEDCMTLRIECHSSPSIRYAHDRPVIAPAACTGWQCTDASHGSPAGGLYGALLAHCEADARRCQARGHGARGGLLCRWHHSRSQHVRFESQLMALSMRTPDRCVPGHGILCSSRVFEPGSRSQHRVFITGPILSGM